MSLLAPPYLRLFYGSVEVCECKTDQCITKRNVLCSITRYYSFFERVTIVLSNAAIEDVESYAKLLASK
jgi:hypothetical protein